MRTPTRPACFAWMLLMVLVAMATRARAVDLFSADFEVITLRPVVTFESELREREAWQEVGPGGPSGWTEVNLTTVSPQRPGSGVTEFAGWRFVDKDWWILTSGDQDRSQYLSGNGIIAVADPDEWDDFNNPAGNERDLDPANGLFDSTLVTPTISLSGVGANQAKLFMHSSWVPEDFQTATITAVYNRGAVNQSIVALDRWASDPPDPDFKPGATNESYTIDLQNPAGASNVQLEFRLQGNNDWWWAIDHVKVFTGAAPGVDGVLRAIINRDTGEVKIENRTGSQINLRGYSVRSLAGAFDEAAASFQADTDTNWLQATQVGGDINDLSELHLNFEAFAANGQISFGNVWKGFYRELSDITFNYLVEGNNNPIRGLIEFVGNGGAEFPYLDLNFSGQVNILDWEQFKLGFASDLTGLTEAARYALGDLDNDKLHTLKDFLEFQRAYDAAQGAGAFAQMLAGSPSVPEPSALILLGIAAVAVTNLRRRRLSKSFAFLFCIFAVAGAIAPREAEAQLTLLFEDFEDVVLGPSVDEGVEDLGGTVGSQVWSQAPPVSITPTTGGGTAPWTIDDSGVPMSGPLDVNGNPSQNGITEWAGWATADQDWWVETAGDQERSRFTRASGNVFIADPDEWDDGPKVYGNPPNFYDAKARTPVITLPAGIPPGRIRLDFDSSWRPEGFDDFPTNNQTAVVRAIYNGGAPIEILRWDSDEEGNFFKPDATNEHITRDLQYNGSATTLQLEFALEKAANDWWWAVDNVLISVPTNPAKLFINTANGRAYFGGNDVIPSSITAISITSKTGLLQSIVGGGLSSVVSETADGPDVGATPGDSPGERWEMLASTNRQFAEAFLFGSSSFNTLRRESLGTLINAATFDQQMAQSTNDIQLTYTLATGELVNGLVEYYFEATVLPGDYNNNGVVDAADYVMWRNNPAAFGGTPAGYNTWRTNFRRAAGAGIGAAAGVPEPTSLLVVALGIAVLVSRLRRVSLPLVAIAVVCALAFDGVTFAADPPPPAVDRLYRFGEGDTMVTVGQPVAQQDGQGNYVTFDTAGQLGQNQLIDLIAVSPSSRRATYVSTTDRPDGMGGIGLRLNELAFDRQYLRTGFGEALNFPEQSPSSSASLVNPGGTLNYFRVNDRGFELWAKPTAITGAHHIVMDSQQHGVLIGQDGKFAMRYASRYTVETVQLPGPDGELGTPDDILQQSPPVITPADYPTGITAQANQWYHLSVVRPFGPGLGSVFYVDGVAQAIAFGEYAVETIVNAGEGGVFTNITDLDVSPLTIGRATTSDPSFGLPGGQEFFFRGIVDDLRMFVMGLNDNDNLPGGGSNTLNDYGEYIFDRDNGYAQKFAPSLDGDMNINGTYDGVISIADANAFATNWLFEKRLSAVNPITGVEGSRLVGDLFTRARGDFNFDGIVDLRDWAILNNANPGMGALAMQLIQQMNVPEPSSFGLAALACLMLTRRSRTCMK